jgi:hypothetical protein
MSYARSPADLCRDDQGGSGQPPGPAASGADQDSRKPDIGIAFDEDPLDTVREMRSSLASMFEQWFANSKFRLRHRFHSTVTPTSSTIRPAISASNAVSSTGSAGARMG